MHFEKRTLLAALLAAASTAPALADETRQTQDILAQWVETRKQTFETKAKWAEEKRILGDMIQLLEREKEQYSARIEELESDADAIESERASLVESRERLRAFDKTLAARIPKYESQVRALLQRLPAPLLNDLDKLARRLPAPDEDSRRPNSQRLLTLVGILNQVEKFDNEVSLVSEIRTREGGSVEVKTVYFGLAGAFYVGGNGRTAGLGLPGPDGWEWREDPSLAEAATELVAVYEGAREAAFVPLPVQAR